MRFPLNRAAGISHQEPSTSFRVISDASDIGTLLTVSSSEPVTLDDVYFYSVVSEGDIFDVTGTIDITNWYVLADYNLPNLTFKSLFKMAFKMFFLTFDENVNRKELDFLLLGNAIDTNNSIDLTGRTQTDNSWKSGDLYGKLNYLGYTNDEDVNENLGRFFFDGLNENSKAVKALIEVGEFSASNEVIISNKRVVQYPIYNVSEAKRQAVSDRIVFFNETGSFGFNATFSELSFSRLYADHYVGFIESTVRERIIEFEALLKYSEFVKLQRNPLIYIEDYSSNFLVTSFDGFEAGRLTKITTIKYG